jgi:hypothetical protein
MFVVDQREQQMLERRIFMTTGARGGKRVVERLLEIAGE